jgi:mono/diheme cytochrome c family protein
MIRRIALFAAAVLLLALAAVWFLNYGDGPVQDAPPSGPPNAQDVQRGAYLARAGNCAGCHTVRGGAAYAGGRPIDTPFGTLYSTNLTPDTDHGLGLWSAGHFWRALHHGRSRDGRLLYPAFPYTHYTTVTREDSDALFAYLRSLPPVNQPNRAHELGWPYRTQWALALWRAMYFRPGTTRPDPQQSAEWNRGAYLVRGLGHCSACHGARNLLGANRNVLDLSGGMIPMQNWYAPALTSKAEASVADWPVEDVVRLLRDGVSPRGSVLGPMGEVVLESTQYLGDADLRAMAVFLKSLPQSPSPQETDPREVPVAATRVLDRGAKLYADQCVQCHGERGEGVPGAYPALAGNRAVTLDVTANLVQVVLYGGYAPSTRGNPRPFGMPPFAMRMGDDDVAAVLTYIRGSWGNKGAPVSALAVAQQRGSSQ